MVWIRVRLRDRRRHYGHFRRRVRDYCMDRHVRRVQPFAYHRIRKPVDPKKRGISVFGPVYTTLVLALVIQRW